MYPPRKPKNLDRRSREYLLPEEVDRMVQKTLERWRGNARRDALLILMMYRHGLRTSEAARLRWDQISLEKREISVERINCGIPSTHPLSDMEVDKLRLIKFYSEVFKPKIFGQKADAIYVFEGSDEKPLKTRTIGHIVATAGKTACLPFPVHPHMLRHTCGYYLANHFNDLVAVQKYLGLKNHQNAMRYFKTEVIEFKNIWNDWKVL